MRRLVAPHSVMFLSHKLAVWMLAVFVAFCVAPLATESEGKEEKDDHARAEDELVLLAITSLASLSLYFIGVLHTNNNVENAKPFAVVGGSFTLAAAITFGGLALASNEREQAAVRWQAIAVHLFPLVLCVSLIYSCTRIAHPDAVFSHALKNIRRCISSLPLQPLLRAL